MIGSQGADVGSGFGCAVLAHWGDDCPVAEGSTADVKRCEECWDFLAIALVDRCSRGHGMLRDEVR